MAKCNLIFIHGLQSSSQGDKATLLRGLYPEILTPDFSGNLEARLAQLDRIIADRRDWIIIGSSLGGLMATLTACQHPERIKKLVLLAPALVWPDFVENPPAPVNVPVVIYHGEGDTVVPIEIARTLAQKVFTNLEFHAVEDDHGLYKTAHALDWASTIEGLGGWVEGLHGL
ncbi:MAG TPA: alpha/beta hydrolase [Chloroflexi bacterium]|nr:alpha/beta hydrolase [Chloroflexota bacterium]